MTLPSFSTHGRQDNPPIILVHALGTDRRFWDDVVAGLKDDFFCVTPDLQAAGQTPIPDEPATAEQHAVDLTRLADHLGLDWFAIAGCALGGMVAAIVAAQNPGRLDALVMTNPGLRNQPEVKEMLRQRAGEVVEQGMDSLLPAATQRSFHNQPRDDRYTRFVESYRALDPRGYASSVLGFLDIDIEPYLSRITCPALIVSGGQDILMPADGAEAVQAHIRHAQIMRFDEAAHFIPYQAPERLTAAMRGFLGETRA